MSYADIRFTSSLDSPKSSYVWDNCTAATFHFRHGTESVGIDLRTGSNIQSNHTDSSPTFLFGRRYAC